MSLVSAPPAIKKHVIIGVAAGLLLLSVYFGIVILIQDAKHAIDQFYRLWYWILALAAGFGMQIGLFSFIRQEMKERRKAATASAAASGGVSAGSMIACCAHHLTEVLPLLGLSGLAAFLVNYQIFFIIVGVLSNAVGMTIMLETIQRHNLCPVVASWKWDMARVKRWTMVSAGVLVAVAFVFNFLTKGANL